MIKLVVESQVDRYGENGSYERAIEKRQLELEAMQIYILKMAGKLTSLIV